MDQSISPLSNEEVEEFMIHKLDARRVKMKTQKNSPRRSSSHSPLLIVSVPPPPPASVNILFILVH